MLINGSGEFLFTLAKITGTINPDMKARNYPRAVSLMKATVFHRVFSPTSIACVNCLQISVRRGAGWTTLRSST